MNPQNPNQQIQLIIQSPNHPQTLTLTAAKQTPLSNLKHHQLPPPSSLYYFSLNGKLLHDSSTVGSLLTSASRLLILTLRPRLLGGGGDGGATGAESRDCYLNMYAERKPDKVDPNEKRLSRWTTCALSFEPLSPPCVVDRLGNVFNKEPLVKSLILKSLPKEFGHIRGLKDMFDVDLKKTEFYCPISGLEFNGKYRFFALASCGHVVSAKALKEVKSSSCLVCHKDFDECDKIVINPSDDEVAELRKKLEVERAVRVSKKGKKGKRNVADVNNDGGNASVKNVDGSIGIAKGGGGGGGENVGKAAKRFKAIDVAPPNANREVYASIFTSSRKSEFKETYSCRSLPLGRN